MKLRDIEGFYSVEVDACPLCNGRRLDRYKIPYRNHYRCQYCGLIYMSPRPTQEALDRLYSLDEYRNSRGMTESMIDANEYKRAQRIGEYVVGDSHLDVGCGRGYLLALSWKQKRYVMGVEPQQGYTLSEIPAAHSIDDIEGQFDTVTCIHTLEHVIDFKGMSLRLVELLAPGGRLIVEVPGQKTIKGGGSDVHLTYFKPEHIKELFKELTLVKIMDGDAITGIFTK